MSSWTNGNLVEIFCTMSLFSVVCFFSTYLHVSGIFPYYREDALYTDSSVVSWHPSLDDPDVYILNKDTQETLVFNPSAFTGSNFIAKIIREKVLVDTSANVKVYDFIGPNRDPMSFEHQAKQMQSVLNSNQIDPTPIFILSDVHIFDLYKETFHPPRTISVSFFRDPVMSFVSAFHYRRYGEQLLGDASRNWTQRDFDDLLAKTSREVEEYVGRGEEVRSFANDVSAVVSFCSRNVSKCHGVHQNRQRWVFSQAKDRASDDTYFVFIMEDYYNIPKLLEKVSPLVCEGLHEYFKENVRWPPWVQARVNLSKDTIDALRLDNRMKLEIRFYEWARLQYNRRKENILAGKLPQS